MGSFEHIAKCALVKTDEPGILFPDIIIRARLKGDILPEYAREYIQSRPGRTYFQQNARTAVGMWKIGGADIATLPIPLPSLSVQQAIMRRVEAGRVAALVALAEKKSTGPEPKGKAMADPSALAGKNTEPTADSGKLTQRAGPETSQPATDASRPQRIIATEITLPRTYHGSRVYLHHRSDT